MALNRAADAVSSYESALQFDMQPEMRNRLYANLGQAYVATGQMQKAVNAFEESIADKTYFLSDSASVDYQRAVAAVAQGTSEITQVMAPVSVPGGAAPSDSADLSGIDVAADGSAMYAEQDPYAAQQTDPYYYGDPYAADAGQYGAAAAMIASSAPPTRSWSSGPRALPSAIASSRNVGLKIFVVIILLVVAGLWRRAVHVHAGLGLPQPGQRGNAAVRRSG